MLSVSDRFHISRSQSLSKDNQNSVSPQGGENQFSVVEILFNQNVKKTWKCRKKANVSNLMRSGAAEKVAASQ